jgi:triphosphoribosyl-dephospho-CoA synthase
MATAAHRDSIASEYASGYAIVFDTGLPLLAQALRDGAPTLEAIVSLHIGLLASYPDTLIARKAGAAAARAVTTAAREVRDGTRSLGDFDASLRGPDNRLNPGTSADLVAATLLAALLSGVRLP